MFQRAGPKIIKWVFRSSKSLTNALKLECRLMHSYIIILHASWLFSHSQLSSRWERYFLSKFLLNLSWQPFKTLSHRVFHKIRMKGKEIKDRVLVNERTLAKLFVKNIFHCSYSNEEEIFFSSISTTQHRLLVNIFRSKTFADRTFYYSRASNY